MPEDSISITVVRRYLRWAVLIVVAAAAGSVARTGGLAAEQAGGRTPARRAVSTDLAELPGRDWPTVGGNLGQMRFSTLKEINASNVRRLELAWTASFDGDVVNEVETELLVKGGVLYAVTGNGNVVATDATNGRKIWQWDTFHPPKPASGNAPIRGLALGAGHVYQQTNIGTVVALDERTGSLKWQTNVSLNGGIQEGSGAPVYHDGVVYVGVSGREQGRGHVDALKADSGELLWRTFMIGTAADDPKTGGAGVWTSPSIDPQLGLLYAVTGNAGVLTTATSAEWSSSIVALHLSTGAIKWAFQGVHHDIWDYDCPSPPTFFDVTIGGVVRHGVEFQCKSGYQFELDRATGEPLLPVREVPIPQAPGGSSPDPAAMAASPFVSPTQPQMQGTNDVVQHCVTREMLLGPAPDGSEYNYTCTYSIPGSGKFTTFTPGMLGGPTWQANAVDPSRGYLYVCAIAGSAQSWKIDPASGRTQRGGRFLQAERGWSGSVAAIDLRTNRTVWLNKWMDGKACLSGVTATAGGVVFTADLQSTAPSKVYAFDSSSGKELWSFQTPQSITSAPIVYAVNGREYVAFIGGGPVPLLGGILAPFRRRDEMYVFALPRRGSKPATLSTNAAPGTATTGTATPGMTARASNAGSAVEAGRAVFVSRCGSCHTLQAAGTTGTAGPNLGVVGRVSAQTVTNAVTQGTSGPLGTMPAFSGTMTKEEIEQVAAYVAGVTAR